MVQMGLSKGGYRLDRTEGLVPKQTVNHLVGIHGIGSAIILVLRFPFHRQPEVHVNTQHKQQDERETSKPSPSAAKAS